jgi:hypothetical protein
MVGGGSTPLSPYKPQKSSFWSRSTYLVKRSRLGFAYSFVLVAVISFIMMATLTPSFVRRHSNSLGPGRRLRPMSETAADDVPFSARGAVVDESHRALSSLTEDALIELQKAIQQDPQVQEAKSAELDAEPVDPLFPSNSGSALDDSTVQKGRTQPKRRSIARMAAVQPPASSVVPNLVSQKESASRASSFEQEKSADIPIKRASNGVEEKHKLMLERSKKRKNGADASKVIVLESTKSVLATGRAVVAEVIENGMDATTEEMTKLDFTHHVIKESPLHIPEVSLAQAASEVDSTENSNLEPARATEASTKSKKADFRTAYIVRKNQSPRSDQVDIGSDVQEMKDSVKATNLEAIDDMASVKGEDKSKEKERSRKDRSQILKRAAAAAGPRPKVLATALTDEAASAQEMLGASQVDRDDNEQVKDSASTKVESTAKSLEATEDLTSTKEKTKKKERSRKDRSQILKRYAAAAVPRSNVLATTEDEAASAQA